MVSDPRLAKSVFKSFYPDLQEVLEIDKDESLPDGTLPDMAFEWIGSKISSVKLDVRVPVGPVGPTRRVRISPSGFLGKMVGNNWYSGNGNIQKNTGNTTKGYQPVKRITWLRSTVANSPEKAKACTRLYF